MSALSESKIVWSVWRGEFHVPAWVQAFFSFLILFKNKPLWIMSPPLTSVIDFARLMVRKSTGEIWGRLLD